jgi:hypothetical protein
MIQTGQVLRYIDAWGFLQPFTVDYCMGQLVVGMDWRNCFVRIPKSQCLILRRVRRFVTERVTEDSLVPLDLAVSSGITKLLKEAA